MFTTLEEFLIIGASETVDAAVVGNEACDADSFVSALVTAFCLSRRLGKIHHPVVQAAVDEFFSLKPEIASLIDFANLKGLRDCLRYAPVSASSWTLTDCNAAPGWLPGEAVTLVIDHHADQGGNLGRAKQIIERVASCCTLVAREFAAELCPTSRKFLLAVIELDSRNGLATPMDLEISGKLAADLNLSREESVSLGKRLANARDDPTFWRRLSPEQKLSMDYKQFSSAGFSTLRIGLSDCKGLAEAVVSRMQGLRVFAVMAALPTGERELAVYSTETELLEKIHTAVVQVGAVSIEGWPGFRVYRICDSRVTRKSIAPLIVALLACFIFLVISSMASEIDELPLLREELARLQAELTDATALEAAAREEFDELNDRIVFDEYSAILASLAPPRQPKSKKPFPRLMAEDDDFSEDAPDAFAFMSLMQASTSNEVSLRALASKLAHVQALSSHNMEELLQLAPRLPATGEGRRSVLLAIASRLHREISRGRWQATSAMLAGVASVYFNMETEGINVDYLIELLAREGNARMGVWPAAQQAEIAIFVGKHGAGQNAANQYLNSLLAWLGTNSYNEELYSPRIIWQMVGALRLGKLQVSANLASQLTVTAERAITKPLISMNKNNTDLHYLAIELAEIRARGTGSLWTTLVEKLTHGAPAIFEVPNTLAACISMGYAHDSLISSNAVALKKHLAKITRPADLIEIAKALTACGDKNATVCKALFERKDLMESSPECCWAVLTAAAVVSCDGTSIAEGALMLRKIENLPEFQEAVSAERKLLVTLGLSPGSSMANTLAAAATAEPRQPTAAKPPVERLRSLLDVLGLSDVELDSVADGVRVDACFPAFKTAVLVEAEPLYNVSVKRFQVTGLTSLRNSVLTRRQWKVISFVSELHPDDKVAVSYLLEHLRKIPYTSVARIASVEDAKRLVTGQRLKVLQIRDLAMVEVARFLLSVLRGSVTIDVLDLADLGLTDYITEVVCEFAVTYMGKYPLGRIDLSGNQLSMGFLQRLLHSLKALGTISRSVEVVLTNNKIDEPLPNSEQTYPVRLFSGPNPGTTEQGITVYLIGL